MPGTHESANRNWHLNKSSRGWIHVGEDRLAVLMDIRHELQRLNELLRCPNFMSIPFELKAIRKNTTRKRKKKKA